MKLGLTTLLKNDEVLHRDGFLYCTNSTEPLNAKVERFHDNGQLKEMYTSIGLSGARVRHKPRLLSDTGPCYISRPLKSWLENQDMEHTRGAPYHPRT